MTQTFLHSKLFPCIHTADHTFGKFEFTAHAFGADETRDSPPSPNVGGGITLQPRVAPTPEIKDPTNIRGLKAIDYTIKLDDGTYLNATGEHADVLFRYLAECERIASTSMMVNLEAPSF